MIHVLITLIVWLIILGVLLWLVRYVSASLGLPAEIVRIINVVATVIAVLVVLVLLLNVFGVATGVDLDAGNLKVR